MKSGKNRLLSLSVANDEFRAKNVILPEKLDFLNQSSVKCLRYWNNCWNGIIYDFLKGLEAISGAYLQLGGAKSGQNRSFVADEEFRAKNVILR